MAAAGAIFLVAVLDSIIAFNTDAVVYSSTSDLAMMCYNTYHPGCQVQQGICYNKGYCPERSKESTTCICGPECSCCVPMTFQDVVLQDIREIKHDIDKISKDIYNISEAIHGSQPSDCKDTYDWCTTVPQSYCIQSHLSEVCPKHCKKCGNSTGTAPTTTAITTTTTTTTVITTPKPTTTVKCGVQKAVQVRIINGTDVNLVRKYSWQVGLKILKSKSYYQCGGSIITDKHILTAAHCFDSMASDGINCNNNLPLEVYVGIGDHNQIETSDNLQDFVELIQTKQIFIHKDYNCRDKIKILNDIAIIELPKAIDLIKHAEEIRPICLPKDDSETYEGLMGTATGWGFDSYRYPNILQEVQLPIMNNSECRKTYNTVENTQICTATEESSDGGIKDACVGDSGGPLSVKVNEQHIQIGIVSFGGKVCATKEKPGVYTRVSKFLDWIQIQVGSETTYTLS